MQRLAKGLITTIGVLGLAIWPVTAAAADTTPTTTITLDPSSAGVDGFTITLCPDPALCFSFSPGGGGENTYSCSVSGSLQPASGGPSTYTVNGQMSGTCTGDGSMRVSACLQQATAYYVAPWGAAFPTAWGGDQACASKSGTNTASLSMSPSWWVTPPGCTAWIRMDMYVSGTNGANQTGSDNQQSNVITVGSGPYC